MEHTVEIEFTCSNSPLEEKLFEGIKPFEIKLSDIYDTGKLLEEIMSLVKDLRGDKENVSGVVASNKEAGTILRGTVTKSFSGVRSL